MKKADHHLYQPSALLKEMHLLTALHRDAYASQKILADRMECSVSSVHGYLHDLEERGLVRFVRHSPHKVEYLLTAKGHDRLNELNGLLVEEGLRIHKQILDDVAEVIRQVAGGGVSDILVLADAETRRLVHRAADGIGVEIYDVAGRFDEAEKSPPDGSGAGSRALLVLGARADDGSERLISRYEHQGVPVFRFPPVSL